MADRSVQKADINRILNEARSVEAPATEESLIQTESIQDFCTIYRGTLRTILLVIIAGLKLFRPAWAEILATVVAYLDKLCPA